jgi:hypothetical protein
MSEDPADTRAVSARAEFVLELEGHVWSFGTYDPWAG